MLMMLAGTHDLELLSATLTSLKLSESSTLTLIPRYDKSLRGGKGDRAPVESWTRVIGRPEVILLEGWMLGFQHISESSGTEQKQLLEAISSKTPSILVFTQLWLLILSNR